MDSEWIEEQSPFKTTAVERKDSEDPLGMGAMDIPETRSIEDEEEEENQAHKIHMLQSLQALQYLKTISTPPIEELKSKCINLPPYRNANIKKTLILDMDETLIHCVDDIETEKPQHIIDVEFEDGEVVSAGINIRPFVYECLNAAKEQFQVVVFTASHKSYADAVLNYLDPDNEFFEY